MFLIFLLSNILFGSELQIPKHLDTINFQSHAAKKDPGKINLNAALGISNPWHKVTEADFSEGIEHDNQDIKYLKARWILAQRTDSIEKLQETRGLLIDSANKGNSQAKDLVALMMSKGVVFPKDNTTALGYCTDALSTASSKQQKDFLTKLKTNLEREIQEEIEAAQKSLGLKPKKTEPSSPKSPNKDKFSAEELVYQIAEAKTNTKILSSLATEKNIGRLQSIKDANPEIVVATSRLLEARGEKQKALSILIKKGKQFTNDALINIEAAKFIDITNDYQKNHILDSLIYILFNDEDENIKKMARHNIINIASTMHEPKAMLMVLRGILEDSKKDRFFHAAPYMDRIYKEASNKKDFLKYIKESGTLDAIHELVDAGIASENTEEKLEAVCFKNLLRFFTGDNPEAAFSEVVKLAKQNKLPMANLQAASLMNQGYVQSTPDQILEFLMPIAYENMSAMYTAGAIMADESNASYNLDVAIPFLVNASEKGSLGARECIANLYVNKDHDLLRKLDEKVIVSYLQEAAQTKERACFNLGKYHKTKGYKAKSKKCFEKGVELKSPECLIALSSLLYSDGKYKEVLDLFEQQKLLLPKDNLISYDASWTKLGCLLKLNKRKEADQFVQKEAASGNPLLQITLASKMVSTSQDDTQIEDALKSVDAAIKKLLKSELKHDDISQQTEQLLKCLSDKGSRIWNKYGIPLMKTISGEK